MQGREWEFLGDINNVESLKGFLVIFISLKILQYLEINSKLWILVIVIDLLRAFFLFGVY